MGRVTAVLEIKIKGIGINLAHEVRQYQVSQLDYFLNLSGKLLCQRVSIYE